MTLKLIFVPLLQGLCAQMIPLRSEIASESFCYFFFFIRHWWGVEGCI